MDWTHFHLMTNHLPVIGAIFGLVILAWGMVRGSDDVKRIGLAVLIFTALIAIPVYLTGEPAEETVESLPGVVHDIIEEHEEFAIYALISAIVTGIASLAALVFIGPGRDSYAKRYSLIAALVLAGVTAAAMGWTANLGGVIRHTENRGASAQSAPMDSERGREKDEDH